MDYGKFKFEYQKKQKNNVKQSVVTVLVRPSPTIDKVTLIQNFVRTQIPWKGKSYRSIRFKGRMITHKEIGAKVRAEFGWSNQDIAIIEQRAKMDGRQNVHAIEPDD